MQYLDRQCVEHEIKVTHLVASCGTNSCGARVARCVVGAPGIQIYTLLG